MRRSLTAVLMMFGLLATACSGHSGETAGTTDAAATTTAAPLPIEQKQLRGLLLTADDANPIMGVKDMSANAPHDVLPDDSATIQPPECLAIDGVAQEHVYAGSGFSGVREQTLVAGEGNAHFVDQAVVLFPTMQQAASFFESAAQRWPECHEYTHTQSGSEWVVGPISNVDGVLSATAVQHNAGESPWQACGRALTARNNVVVDVNTCSADPKDSAVVIATRIAERIPVEPDTRPTYQGS